MELGVDSAAEWADNTLEPVTLMWPEQLDSVSDCASRNTAGMAESGRREGTLTAAQSLASESLI